MCDRWTGEADIWAALHTSRVAFTQQRSDQYVSSIYRVDACVVYRGGAIRVRIFLPVYD